MMRITVFIISLCCNVWSEERAVVSSPPAKVVRIAAMAGISDSARIAKLTADAAHGEKVVAQALRYRIWVFGRNSDRDALYDLYSEDGAKWIIASPGSKGLEVFGKSDVFQVKRALDRIVEKPIDFSEDGSSAISSSHRCILVERIQKNDYQWAIREFTGMDESGYWYCCKAIEMLEDLEKSSE